MVIFFTVTNDLSYDQRMIRICTSLANAGYKINLVGRKLDNSIELIPQSFQQKRLPCFFKNGKLFYAEYNLRLFFYLLFHNMDCICAIDLDTILPCYLISKIKKIKRVYDAHELFCEMNEVIARPAIYKFWKKLEKYSVPKFINGYTVSKFIADEFYQMYGVNYEVIRNLPIKHNVELQPKKERFILYQGAVNFGRSFGTIIPAMEHVNCKLVVCGEGNFFQEAKQIVTQNRLDEKIDFKGYVQPHELRIYTSKAYIGLNLLDDIGLNNHYSLANRFFDYMHAGLPQLCVDLPGYREVNNKYEVAVLISDLSPENIGREINNLLNDEPLYERLHQNCLQAREEYNWQNEEKKLISFYQKLIG